VNEETNELDVFQDRDFVKFERSHRYRDRYRCQSRRGRARDLVFRDPPTPRTRARSLFAVRDSPPPALCSVPEFIEKMQCGGSGAGIRDWVLFDPWIRDPE